MIVVEELQCVERVVDRGGPRDTEYRRDMKRVTAAGEGFLELSIDPQPFKWAGWPRRSRIQVALTGPW